MGSAILGMVEMANKNEKSNFGSLFDALAMLKESLTNKKAAEISSY